jgi:hypothetical protein
MSDRDEIANTLSRFVNCFDLKDWQGMEALLESTLRIDYSSLRGEPPGDVAAAAYVRSRAEALQQLSTHHLLANVEIAVADETAAASASCMIWRWNGAVRFDSHAYYVFALVKRARSWKICGIEQRIFWSEGDPAIHHGAARGRA